MLSDVLVAFDHLKHTVTILANAYVDERRRRGRATRARSSAIARGARAARRPAAARRAARRRARSREFESNMPREAFEAMVARIIEYIHAGDAYQVVP